MNNHLSFKPSDLSDDRRVMMCLISCYTLTWACSLKGRFMLSNTSLIGVVAYEAFDILCLDMSLNKIIMWVIKWIAILFLSLESLQLQGVILL